MTTEYRVDTDPWPSYAVKPTEADVAKAVRATGQTHVPDGWYVILSVDDHGFVLVSIDERVAEVIAKWPNPAGFALRPSDVVYGASDAPVDERDVPGVLRWVTFEGGELDGETRPIRLPLEAGATYERCVPVPEVWQYDDTVDRFRLVTL